MKKERGKEVVELPLFVQSHTRLTEMNPPLYEELSGLEPVLKALFYRLHFEAAGPFLQATWDDYNRFQQPLIALHNKPID